MCFIAIYFIQEFLFLASEHSSCIIRILMYYIAVGSVQNIGNINAENSRLGRHHRPRSHKHRIYFNQPVVSSTTKTSNKGYFGKQYLS